mmetsp:Transcript_125193/g.243613  ORF Transcript_125193/g.243613 Transcript_125193/m.243613 type:complete len:579 (+) Transcript_125193:55-1791(+)
MVPRSASYGSLQHRREPFTADQFQYHETGHDPLAAAACEGTEAAEDSGGVFHGLTLAGSMASGAGSSRYVAGSARGPNNDWEPTRDLKTSWSGPLDLTPQTQRMPHRRFMQSPDGTVSVRHELRSVEDKLSRQLIRLQDQTQRLMDMMLQPLEKKVGTLEGRQKGVDGQIAEMCGGIRGLQDALELQVQRSDAAEARFQRWRQNIEAILPSVGSIDPLQLDGDADNEAAKTRTDGFATRQELLEVADILRQELGKLVAGAMPRCGVTDKELSDLAASLRQELCANHGSTHETLQMTAQSLRHELRRLTETSLQGGCGGGSELDAGVLSKLHATCEAHEVGLQQLALRSEQQQEEGRNEVQRLREDLHARGVLDAQGWVTAAEVERIAELVCNRQDQRLCASGSPASQEDALVAIRDLQEKEREAAVRTDRLAADTAMCKQMTETTAIVAEAATMRLDALEERQSGLRDEIRGGGAEANVRRLVQVAVEDETLKLAVDRQQMVAVEQQLQTLTSHMEALENRPGSPSNTVRLREDDLLRRVEALEQGDVAERAMAADGDRWLAMLSPSENNTSRGMVRR